MASSIAVDLATMATTHSANGSTGQPNNSGKQGTPGSGVKAGSVQRAPSAPAGPPQARQPVQVQKPQAPPKAPQRHPQQAPRFSAQNPMMGTAPPPAPHPGVMPPFPDARSPQPTLMPNGVPIVPPPPGFPLAGAIPRVPPSFAPGARPPMGMTGLLGR